MSEATAVADRRTKSILERSVEYIVLALILAGNHFALSERIAVLETSDDQKTEVTKELRQAISDLSNAANRLATAAQVGSQVDLEQDRRLKAVEHELHRLTVNVAKIKD